MRWFVRYVEDYIKAHPQCHLLVFTGLAIEK